MNNWYICWFSRIYYRNARFGKQKQYCVPQTAVGSNWEYAKWYRRQECIWAELETPPRSLVTIRRSVFYIILMSV
jgi:hypothetical protein